MDPEITIKGTDGHSTTGIFASDLEKRITEAFEIFDHSGNKTIDVREVGTVLRSLGCCPTEAEIQEILVKVEDHETSSVQLRTFLSVITQIITERKLQPAPPEELLRAFHTLDKEGRGFITKEYLSKLITEEGEPFMQEELDELLAAAVDSDTGNIHYEYYINQIMVMHMRFSGSPDTWLDQSLGKIDTDFYTLMKCPVPTIEREAPQTIIQPSYDKQDNREST